MVPVRVWVGPAGGQRAPSRALARSPATAPNGEGVLVIDEHGDRKWGKRTAHVGRQWLANLGKIDNASCR